MAEESELIELFFEECSEGINQIEALLKQIEVQKDSHEMQVEVFRICHTLKGNARMLGFTSIEKLFHLIESALNLNLSNAMQLNDDALECINDSLEAIRQLLHETVKGIPININIVELIQKFGELVGVEVAKAPPAAGFDLVGKKTGGSSAEVAKLSTVTRETVARTDEQIINVLKPVESYTVENALVHVPVKTLNSLLNQTRSLTVATNEVLDFYDRLVQVIDVSEREYQYVGKKTTTAEYQAQLLQLLKKLDILQEEGYQDFHRLEFVTSGLGEQIGKMGLVYLSKLFFLYRRMVADVAKIFNKSIDLIVSGREIAVDKKIIETLKAPLMHLLRNAVYHGIEGPEERKLAGKPPKGTITLSAQQTSNAIIISVVDDGKGIDLDKIKAKAIEMKLYNEDQLAAMNKSQIQSLILLPGFSTATEVSDISGRGIGLDVVRQNIEQVYGSLEIDSTLGEGTRFSLKLPISHVTTHVMLIKANKTSQIMAIPLDVIDSCSLIETDDIFFMDGRDVIYLNDLLMPVFCLDELLSLDTNKELLSQKHRKVPCLVIKTLGDKVVILVESILDEQNIVVSSVPPILSDINELVGATILKDGSVCNVFNPVILIAEFKKTGTIRRIRREKDTSIDRSIRKTILIVDDSFTSRQILRNILEKNKEFEIIEAADGLDALHQFHEKRVIDAVVADVDMPNMNGIELCIKLRSLKASKKFPIILLSSLSGDKDIKRGLDAGANMYLVKSEASAHTILQTLNEMLTYSKGTSENTTNR